MQINKLIFEQLGLKATASRLKVAEVLAQNDYPVTHLEIIKQLPDTFDRVTVYRVLDWLLQNNVIHRIAGADRAWRFQINPNIYSSKFTQVAHLPKTTLLKQHTHAHFQCDVCGKVYCLEDVHPKLSTSIPDDFIVAAIELNITGKCAQCHQLANN